MFMWARGFVTRVLGLAQSIVEYDWTLLQHGSMIMQWLQVFPDNARDQSAGLR